MAYLAPIHRASSVRHAIRINFLSTEDECLIVAKANRLEIYEHSPDGLSLLHSKAIYGNVTMLQKLRPASSDTDHLFVGTDLLMYFTLSWDAGAKELKTEKSYVDVADKSALDSQTGDRCLIDPSLKFMTLELFEGIVTVVPIGGKGKKKKLDVAVGTLGEPIPARISEMFVRSSAFLYPRSPETDKSRLALLYEDTNDKVRLKLRQIEYSAGAGSDPGLVELEQVANAKKDLELGASHLIPLEEPIYGLLVLGETSITYVSDDLQQMVTMPLDAATIFVAWERIDSQRFLLADEYRRLYLLMLVVLPDNSVPEWKLDIIGETSRASVLVYLDGGHIFVGSHQGDSQVIKITDGSIEVVQVFANIAPILDFTIMDMGNRSGEAQSNEYSSGQARIVTGSGAYSDGSLRSVRSGVGLEDLGVLGEMEHILNLFSIAQNPLSNFVDTLIVTFIDETRVFSFSNGGDVEEVDEFMGMVLSEHTLLATNLPHGRLLQVVPSGVRVTELESGMTLHSWNAPSNHEITAVAVNDELIVVSQGGVRLAVLELEDALKEAVSREFGAESQVACLTLTDSPQSALFVGFWQNTTVAVLDVKTLQVTRETAIAESSVPRSLLLANLFEDQPPTLFIAMADGSLVTFTVTPGSHDLTRRKSIILGTQQATLHKLPRGNGSFNVFASCEHASLIYASDGRPVYSAVTAEDATAVCSFNSVSYPGAIAIATAEDLRIGLIDTERTTHVQTLAIDETVRRIAYAPSLKSFGMGTIKRTLANGVEIAESHFKLADEVVFKELDSYALNEDELIECVIQAELDDGTGDMATRFLVGTAYLDDEKYPDERGRIIVFEVTEDRVLKVVTELSLKGCCRCLSIVDGMVVAALTKAVVIYKFKGVGGPSLEKRAAYRTSTTTCDLYVNGTTIVVADMMKSISVLEYVRGQDGADDKLSEVARHYYVSWATAVAEVAENTYLESDAEGNLIVLFRDTNGVTEDDRRRLRITSDIRLGEMVNRIRRIDVNRASDAAVMPRAFLATVDGSIYLFALINPSKQNLLMSLQSNLAEHVQSPGHVPFNKYRAFKSRVTEMEEPNRFVDGDLIERFLDCDAGVQEKVIEGLGVDVEEMKAMVEMLKRLH